MGVFSKIIIPFMVVGLLISCSKNSNIKHYNQMPLKNNWELINSKKVNDNGEFISKKDYNSDNWYKSTIPSTVLASLVKNNVYTNLYLGKNLLKVPSEQFENAWWYRKEFELTTEQTKKNIALEFSGINQSADLWINGVQIADKKSFYGAFRQFKFNISENVKKGKNVIAVKLFPPEDGDFTIGFVDWNPTPPDKNMGIWREVKLHLSDDVSINNTFVTSKLETETLSEAVIKITTKLSNYEAKEVKGKLIAIIGDVVVKKEVTLRANESKIVELNAESFNELNFKNPRIWWPNNLGEPNLYGLRLNFEVNDLISDTDSVTFGIRKVEDYLDENNYRGYKINGRKLLIKGGGWVNDLLLDNSYENIEAQIKYAKQMNLNTVRLEGFWGKDNTIYDLCDKYGLLIMVGWSCHWEWEEYINAPCDEYGCIVNEEQMNLLAESLRDQVLWLRNHPSIFVWLVGSDKIPRPKLEKKYVDVLNEYDPSRPYLAAAGGFNSEVSGPTGVKMNGPYAFTPPVYWYEDTKNGGAFGFNTETGPGAQPPVLESIKKMIPKDKLWPINSYWEYHSGRNNFNTLDKYEKALYNRYGSVDNVKEFAQKAQIMNYELIRPMFEAFAINKEKTTGIIQWMLNSSWPEMYWQLYDSYLIPTGALYGAQKANEPLHIAYNYGDKSFYAINEYSKKFRDIKAEIKVYNIDSKEIASFNLTFDINKNSSKRILPADVAKIQSIKDISEVYFIDLRLYDVERELIGNNFYWLSKKADVLNYEESEWYYTPIKQYADYKKLNNLPKVKVDYTYTITDDNDKENIIVTLNNLSDKIAFFIELKVMDGSSSQLIAPIFWDDNYISLLPGEKRSVKATYYKKDISSEKPIIEIIGFNTIK